MIIKMVNKFKLTVAHVAHPNPMDNPMQICARAWSYRWTKSCGKTGLGCRPLRAMGHGLPGHWAMALAVGLLLANPFFDNAHQNCNICWRKQGQNQPCFQDLSLGYGERSWEQGCVRIVAAEPATSCILSTWAETTLRE